jgi:hypothetical protein
MCVTTKAQNITVQLSKGSSERTMTLTPADLTYLSEQILLLAIGKGPDKSENQEEREEHLLARLNYPAR